MRAPFFVTAAAAHRGPARRGARRARLEAAREVQGGVPAGHLAAAYRACLWSRVANRVLWQLAGIPGADAQALYAGVREIDWAAPRRRRARWRRLHGSRAG